MKNQTLLITGGTTGIGLATAQLLAADGARVIVTGRNPGTLAAARDQLPATALVLQSDSGDIAQAQALGAALQQRGIARLDGAFLNAGIGQFGPIEAMTPKQFDDMFNVNVRGLFFQLQSLMPLLASPASVLLNASVVAELGLPATSVYSATKPRSSPSANRSRSNSRRAASA
jgi:NAD(P)-dependent dehydrogenase (short-subunit alcohol dehydrogenase family)